MMTVNLIELTEADARLIAAALQHYKEQARIPDHILEIETDGFQTDARVDDQIEAIRLRVLGNIYPYAPPVPLRGQYNSEQEATMIADWLCVYCTQNVGGIWRPHVFENLGWHCFAALGDPYIATMVAYSNGTFHGGFTYAPGSSGFLQHEGITAESPREVLRKSHRAVQEKAKWDMLRLDKIMAANLKLD